MEKERENLSHLTIEKEVEWGGADDFQQNKKRRLSDCYYDC